MNNLEFKIGDLVKTFHNDYGIIVSQKNFFSYYFTNLIFVLRTKQKLWYGKEELIKANHDNK